MAFLNRPPPPSGQTLSLVSALSNPENHELHLAAIRARDEALGNETSYGECCVQLSYVLIGADQPERMVNSMDSEQLQQWKQTDAQSVAKLEQNPDLWITFGQIAGLILKNSLLRPPIVNNRALSLSAETASHVKSSLLYALSCQSPELRAVASTVIATSAVSADSVQPALHIRAWPNLMGTLIENLQQQQQQASCIAEGSIITIRKIMEDGPHEVPDIDLDHLVPVLIQCLLAKNHQPESVKVAALQSLAACISTNLFPAALVAHFNEYLQGLSALASDHTSNAIRQWVCRNIVTLLDVRTEYLAPHLGQICPFMLAATDNVSSDQHDDVALEACDFWLTFASLEDGVSSAEMHDVVGALLPQLIPVLLRNMVYSTEKRLELQAANELDETQHHSSSIGGNIIQQASALKPIFHKSRAQYVTAVVESSSSDDGYEEDDEGYNEFDDDWNDDNEWTVRKCAAASLDALANLYGGDIILPSLLPVLQAGFAGADPWTQEACILALGAVAEGCHNEMNAHLGQIHPYLLHLLADENSLPQIKCIAAWSLGQYASWAVDQVQSGAQGHLLAQMTEVLLTRLSDKNSRVQVSVASAFGVVAEAAGDLLAPYLEHIYQALTTALSNYQGRSLLAVFDILGIIADCCGPTIAEGELPTLYVPQLLKLWDDIAKNDPRDRTLLPLMESLASIALTSGMNFQPYALECFDKAMCIIESITLLLAGEQPISNEEDVDPIICAADLLDGLVEGLDGNFAVLLNSSRRYGPLFLNVLLILCQHEIAGVRMSALALLGDLARHAASILQPALPQLLQEAVDCMDPVQASVATNAVWAIGEICLHCQGNPAILEPYASSIVQNLIGLLMGNGDRGTTIPGLCENAASCAGRLAKANANFVAPDLARFLLGWCDAMAKISDVTERRDAFQGFVLTVYANPQAIREAATNVEDAIVTILFAVVSWHMPSDNIDPAMLTTTDYNFLPFPSTEAELGAALVKLLHDIKSSVVEETWHSVQKSLPVNVRRLLRESYQL